MVAVAVAAAVLLWVSEGDAARAGGTLVAAGGFLWDGLR